MRISSFYPFAHPGVKEEGTWVPTTDALLVDNVNTFVSMLRAGDGFRNIEIGDIVEAGQGAFRVVSYEVFEVCYQVEVIYVGEIYAILENNKKTYLTFKDGGLWLEPIE